MESVSLRHQDFHGSPDSAIITLRNNVGIPAVGQLVENLYQSNVFIKRKTSGINSSEYYFECAG